MRRLLLLPSLLLLLPSCATTGYHHRHTHGGSGGVDVAIAVIELFGAIAQVAAASEERERFVVEAVPAGEIEPPREPAPHYAPLPPRPPPPPSTYRPLDPAAPHAALAERKVVDCAPWGLPRGYGHATVTFAPDGTVSSVALDAPQGVSERAAACVRDELATAKIPPFSGGAVTAGTTWFVP